MLKKAPTRQNIEATINWLSETILCDANTNANLHIQFGPLKKNCFEKFPRLMIRAHPIVTKQIECPLISISNVSMHFSRFSARFIYPVTILYFQC